MSNSAVRVLFLVIGAGVVWLAMTLTGARRDTSSSGQYIHTCSNATIAGQYGFQDDGTRVVDGKMVPYSAVRTAQFSGEGKHEGKGYVSIGGHVTAYTVTGKFTVAGDCTFVMDAVQTYGDGTAATPYKQFGIVVHGGKEILELQTSSDRIQSGKYQKLTDY